MFQLILLSAQNNTIKKDFSTMWSIFSRHKPGLLGIDIGSRSVKLLELSQWGDGYCVKSCAVTPLCPAPHAEGSMQDPVSVSEAIKQAVTRSGTRLQRAAVAVKSACMITQLIELTPDLQPHEIEMQVQLEARRYIPYPMEDVHFDFVVQDREKILIVATQTDNVAIRVDALKRAGLTAHVVDVESYAMERACSLIAPDLPNRGADKTIAIVNIEATVTTLHVLHDRLNIYSHEEIFATGPWTGSLLQEKLLLVIRRGLQLFFSTSGHNGVDHIVLAGAASLGLSRLISKQLGVGCSIANPFLSIQAPAHIDPSLFMISCGLALRSFD